MPALEREHLRLHPPAVGVGQVERRLKIGAEMSAHGVVLLALEEALARPGFLQLGEQGEAQELALLVGQAQHLAEHGQLAVHRAVRRAGRLTLDGVGGGLSLANVRRPTPGEEAVQVGQAPAASFNPRHPVTW